MILYRNLLDTLQNARSWNNPTKATQAGVREAQFLGFKKQLQGKAGAKHQPLASRRESRQWRHRHLFGPNRVTIYEQGNSIC